MKNIVIGVLVVTVLVTVGFMAKGSGNSEQQSIAESNNITVTLHKSPTCGCCGTYGKYLEDLGYEVTVNETENMSDIKKELSVPYELESCHTSEVAGYVVEGHVPAEAIAKLLEEKPDIKGIGMSGMPSGSPGMPGPKEDFNIYTINKDGSKGDLFVTL